jgi:GT2 family glycosyltransferase
MTANGEERTAHGQAAARVTAIVLNYDGRELLEAVLPSLFAQDYRDFRVLVVDNGSRDGSAAMVRERWPTVQVLELPDNVGVAAALNRGVRCAAGSQYVALLNNDLELDPGWLGRLVGTLEEYPGAASATGKMLNFHRRDELDGAGDLLMWSGAASHRGVGEPDDGRYDEPASVFSPCAGAALYRSEALANVGEFDEDFFAYQEDVDWGFRAQLYGWSARYEPRAIAYHMGGATTRRDGSRYGLLQRRNQILVVIKNYPARALWRHAPKVLSYQAGWIVSSMRERMLGRQLRALAAVIPALPGALRKRRAIQSARRVELHHLDTVMTPVPYAGQGISERVKGIVAILLNDRDGA